MDILTSIFDLIGDEDPTDEDRDNGMGDPTGGLVSLRGVEESIEENDRKRARFQGGIISLGRKKSRGSNSGDGGNTGDESKMGNGVIGACGRGIGYSLLVALYTCMTFIYRSSWKGEMVSEAERSLDKSSEGSEEVFHGEAGE
ncbi:hypothetical protein Tco_1568446 [Tanacetum coccineum]